MASGSYNTQAEWLQKINQDLSAAMACPDADLQFLTDIQTQVLQKLRSPYDTGGAAGPQLPPLNAGPGMPGGMPMPGPVPPGGIVPAGGPIGGMGPTPMASTNPDELRRILSQ